ncbi:MULTISPECIES: conjugative transposon protein TraM [Flavobacteriaceae]|uniref:conjugative transposon protein TraM n=1 Tax=Flavobacteriaceae TaxID=49546 RepID=UPI0014909BE9|nr:MULTISPECIES: conjugative transposon protein TraM [Allomuricauda]MDC6367205.1 conjugative transposon protein TraM [Muricauda sp. AC10]
MNELLEKFKNMEPKQRIVIVLGVLFILTSPLLFMGGDGSENEDFEEFETPENRDKIEDYNSKLEAYDDNSKNDDSPSIEFNLDDFKEDEDEEEAMEREIDSMMNLNKRADAPRANPQKVGHRSSAGGAPARGHSASPDNNKAQVNKNVGKEFDAFFTAAPKSQSSSDAATSQTDPFIFAVIHGDHTIKQGERVKLRLTQKATIAGMEFDQNSYVYAFPSFQNNRVLLTITSINHVPVSISAYDTEDSALGLYVKGARMVGEVVDESSKDAVDDVDVGGVPVGSTIKKVFQKKQEQPTVTLLNNTKLILKPKS